MAVKKQAAARRPAQHKKTNTASNKKPASNKKTAAGKNIPPPKSTARTPDTNPKRERFIKGIVLLGLAFITAMLFFMEGEKVWKALYESFWGLFGYLGFFVPLIIFYCACQMFRTKSTYRFSLKVFFFSGTVVMLASMIFAFGSDGMEVGDYGTELMNCFNEAKDHNGTGFIGGVLGIPLARFLGSVAGGLVALLILMFFVYMSFEALFMNVIDRLKEPVNEKISEHKEIRTKVREEEIKINAESRRKIREANVKRKVDAKVSAKKHKAESRTMKRIDKMPIYEPDTSSPYNVKKTRPPKPAGPQLPENAGIPTESPDISSVIPDTSPATTRKDPEPVPMPETDNTAAPASTDMDDFFDDGIDIDDETIDIAALLKKGEEAHRQDTNSIINGVSAAQTGSSPAVSKNVHDQTNERKTAENDKVRPSELGRSDNNTDETEVPAYLKPPFTLLESQPEESGSDVSQELHHTASKLVDTLKSFGVQTTITNICRGPAVTRYELQPAAGVKISKITNLADDIAMNLAATGVRIEAPIPGKNAVGVEVPNRIVSTVKMRELVESNEFQNAKSKLTVVLGKDITGKIMLADLSRMPHLLIAGSTGSGKSVCINSMLVSLLYKADPDEVKFILIDPKVVELGVYNGIPHLLVPVVTDPRKAAGALNWAVNEMLERYKTFAEFNVRDMHSYNRLVDKQNTEPSENYSDDNERTFEEDEMLAQAQAEIKNSGTQPKEIQKLKKMPQIVIIIDELADLMMAAPNEVEESICRLAQMARAAGMHLVIATQRPSVDVITGLIKANVPSRIAFAVKTNIDSRTILDTGGAEKLLGRGDMLYSPIGTTKAMRVQGCFVDDQEIENIINFIKHNKVVEYDADVIDQIEHSALPDKEQRPNDAGDDDVDPVMEQAIQCVIEAGQASTSLLQRRLRLGYARAGRLIDEMEQMGIVGPHEGSKPRQVLMTYQQWLERNMQK